MAYDLSNAARLAPSTLQGALPVSLPALHYMLASQSPPSARAGEALDALRGVVQAFRIGRGLAPETEAEQAAHVVRHLLDRMTRLRGAYGEWRTFDAPAYFDLTNDQAWLLLEMGERVTVVHTFVHADLLLPSMQDLLGFWVQVGPAPRAGDPLATKSPVTEEYERYAQQLQPELVRRWKRASAVVRACRRVLTSDVTWIAANAAEEERWRWRSSVSQGVTNNLAIALDGTPIAQIPTLALTIDFPLPAWRQAGRVRRLRRNRDHRSRKSRRR